VKGGKKRAGLAYFDIERERERERRVGKLSYNSVIY